MTGAFEQQKRYTSMQTMEQRPKLPWSRPTIRRISLTDEIVQAIFPELELAQLMKLRDAAKLSRTPRVSARS
jgi:hypothetical protein